MRQQESQSESVRYFYVEDSAAVNVPNDLADSTEGGPPHASQPLVAESVRHHDGSAPVSIENQAKTMVALLLSVADPVK